LLLTPDGGVLVHTPTYGKEQNTQSRNIQMVIDSTGKASVMMNAVYRGLNYSYTVDLLFLSPEKQKEELISRYSIPGLKVSSFSIQATDEIIPASFEKIELKINDYASLSGPRIFIPLTRLLDRVKSYTKSEDRKFDLVLIYSYSYSDSLVIVLPNGYRLESQPSTFELKSKFGTIRTEEKIVGSSILFIRHYEREKGTFPPSAYNEFVEFTKKIAKQDGRKIVLVRE
jgi:hypothetical protein